MGGRQAWRGAAAAGPAARLQQLLRRGGVLAADSQLSCCGGESLPMVTSCMGGPCDPPMPCVAQHRHYTARCSLCRRRLRLFSRTSSAGCCSPRHLLCRHACPPRPCPSHRSTVDHARFHVTPQLSCSCTYSIHYFSRTPFARIATSCSRLLLLAVMSPSVRAVPEQQGTTVLAAAGLGLHCAKTPAALPEMPHTS